MLRFQSLMYLGGNHHNHKDGKPPQGGVHVGRFTTDLNGPDMLRPNSDRLVANMKAELQEVMNMLRKLQGAIDFGNAPMTEREELAGDVADIMDALFEAMKKLPDE